LAAPLIRAMNDRDKKIALQAMTCLSALGAAGSEAITALQKMLQNDDQEMRESARLSLKSILREIGNSRDAGVTD
ncbi:MAG TPA: hypothetical protein VG099_09025, partial [Gemmataceae bacterium]|nr:hypothetical protein [Gemmataceae bacterium]